MLWERVVPFETDDGRHCSVIQVRGARAPERGPVLLVHGAGVRANIFRPPVPVTLVHYLVAQGYDVWLENWRASTEFPPNLWTLDQAAVYDHPRAVETVCRESGAATIKAVIHCQGSTSFMMAAVAGLLPQVELIISNAVSLHPVVPGFSRFKLNAAVPLVGLLTPYLNPQWGLFAPGLTAKAIRLLVNLTHHECDNAVCKQVSFTYGTGFPTLWDHENLDEATHEWIKGEFGHVPLRFFRQMAASVRNGSLLPAERLPELPADPCGQPPKTDARIVLMTGARNRCFLPESQRRSFEWLERHRPGRQSLLVIPGYGHLDVFIGKDAARDVFPSIVAAIEGALPSNPEVTEMTTGPLGIRFRETMAGHFSLDESLPHAGERGGKRSGTTLAMHATVTIRDMERFISDPDHAGELTGHIDFTPFGTGIPAHHGKFNLFSPSDDPQKKYMVYELGFEHDGQPYYLAGRKEVKDDPGFDLWSDTTTLFTRLHAGEDASAPVVGAGVLTLGVTDLLKLISTMTVLGARGVGDNAAALGKFGRFFLGELWESYAE